MKSFDRSRAGFSLLELVVVLAIIAVLGGLIIGVVPSLLTRAHLAKCADTIAELNKGWMRSYSMNLRYPDYYDSLLDSDQEVPGYLTSGLRGETTLVSLEPGEVAALGLLGVRRVIDGVPGATNTYNYAPYGAVPRLLATSPQVLALNFDAHEARGNILRLKRHLTRQSDGSYLDQRGNTRYVVFGVGPNCTGVGPGRLIQEAPVHFAAADEINPSMAYQRYLIVFSIVHDGAGNYTAYFEASAGNDVQGLSSAEAHTQQFHESTSRDE